MLRILFFTHPLNGCAADFKEQHTANSMDTESSMAEEALQPA